MTHPRTLARTAGALYFVTHVTSVAAVVLYGGSAFDADAQLGCPLRPRGSPVGDRARLGIVGTAIALILLRSASPATAGGYLGLRTLEATVVLIGVVAILPAVARPATTAAPGLEPATIAGLHLLHDWTFLIGPGLVGPVHVILLAGTLLRRRQTPTVIPVLALVGAPLLLAVNLGVMFGLTTVQPVAALPLFAWEISLAHLPHREGVASNSLRRKSSAVMTLIWRIWSRWPGRRNVWARSAPPMATPTHKVPTGMPSCSVGPATPVSARPTSAPSTRRAPAAIATAAALADHRPFRHTEHGELDLAGVADHSPTEHLAGPGHIGEPTGHQAPGDGFRQPQREPALAQQLQHDGLHRVLVRTEDDIRHHGRNLALPSGQQCVGLRCGGCLGREAHLQAFPAARQERQRRVADFVQAGDHRVEPLVEPALARHVRRVRLRMTVASPLRMSRSGSTAC